MREAYIDAYFIKFLLFYLKHYDTETEQALCPSFFIRTKYELTPILSDIPRV